MPVAVAHSFDSGQRGAREPGAASAERASAVGDALLALGLLLTTASQLRLSGLPVGPGELCLTAWLLLMLGRELSRGGPPLIRLR